MNAHTHEIIYHIYVRHTAQQQSVSYYACQEARARTINTPAHYLWGTCSVCLPALAGPEIGVAAWTTKPTCSLGSFKIQKTIVRNFFCERSIYLYLYLWWTCVAGADHRRVPLDFLQSACACSGINQPKGTWITNDSCSSSSSSKRGGSIT